MSKREQQWVQEVLEVSCFKTYDIRGRLPDELNPDVARAIGAAYVAVTGAKEVVVGRDARLSSPDMSSALCEGLVSEGADVWDLGLCGTECVYFATFSRGLDGGIMVTASHNPADYNGMKLVAKKARPISQRQLRAIESLVGGTTVSPVEAPEVRPLDIWEDYLDFLCDLVSPESLGKMKVVCDGGNGAVGPLLARLADRYPTIDMVLLNETPDGTFPNGVPNPLLPEKRSVTSRAVVEHQADFGVAWDGDYDRCFFYDEQGEFVETYYLIGHLAKFFLEREPGASILHDPRLTWHTVEKVESLGGQPVLCPTGHVFFKEMMASRQAVYGAEMSGHHYFRDFGNCDSGVLPFLMLARILEDSGKGLSDLVSGSRADLPISGEINRRVSDSEQTIKRVYQSFSSRALIEDRTDGLSLEFEQWRFNLRSSNTEPLLRLNVEARDPLMLKQRTEEILAVVDSAS